MTKQANFCSQLWWRSLKLLTHACRFEGVLTLGELDPILSSICLDSIVPFLAWVLDWEGDREIQQHGRLMVERLRELFPKDWLVRELHLLGGEDEGRAPVFFTFSFLCNLISQEDLRSRNSRHTLVLLNSALDKVANNSFLSSAYFIAIKNLQELSKSSKR